MAGSETLRFPTTIGEKVGRLVIGIFKNSGYTAEKQREINNQLVYNKESSKVTIGLPIPDNITDSLSVGWSDEEILDFLQIGTKIVSEATPTAVGKSLNFIGEREGKTYGRQNFQKFQNVSPQTFNWNWDLVPRDASEASTINKIIYQLKLASLPNLTGSNFFLEYPDTFGVQITGPFGNTIKFLDMILTDISANYAPDGTFVQYTDGGVPATQLSLTFTEISARTKSIQSRMYGTNTDGK